MLIIPHLISHIDNQSFFLVLGKGPNEGVNDSIGAAEKKSVLTLVKHIQNFASLYISKVMKVTCM